MAEPARMKPQRIKVSSKRQITIPAKAYRDMGFTEYAWMEQTDEGLLIKPLAVDDEDISLSILRKLVDEGYKGEALVARYAEVCPRVVKFQDIQSQHSAVPAPVSSAAQSDAQARCDERACVFRAVADECSRYPAITRAFVFGSFARGDFAAESDVDVRIEYDKSAPFSLFEVAQLQKHIERAVGREVDVITAKRLKNKNLEAAIEREKVLVYERESE